MDEIRTGTAAHWRYKGIKRGNRLDEWLTSVREALENVITTTESDDQFKMDLYEDEVFVFTPKGDLFNLPKELLISHSTSIAKLGCKCIGAKVNGKNVQLKQNLNSGDQVEIMTSNTQNSQTGLAQHRDDFQSPAPRYGKALKEMVARQHDFAKETLERKFKNRKMGMAKPP